MYWWVGGKSQVRDPAEPRGEWGAGGILQEYLPFSPALVSASLLMPRLFFFLKVFLSWIQN